MNFNRILLVIDMQLCAFDGLITPAICDAEAVLHNTANLIRQCRAAKVPVVYIQTTAVSGQPYARDAHGWEIHSLVAPIGDELVFYKQNSSAFDGTDLAAQLQQRGVKRVLACGIWSEYCLASTALDALAAGFEVCVAADAHGTVATHKDAAREVVEAQNKRLAKQGIEVRPVVELP